jgi:hypothetical protein
MNKKLLLTCMIFAAITAHCQTSIPGGNVSGTWNLAGSPYLIQGSIMVPNGSTLTIEPGVTVNFQGHYKFLVLGQLLAQGTNTDKIFFTATNTSTGWYGIRFDNTSSTNDTSRFSFCDIKWGKANGTGLDAAGGAFMLNNFSKIIITHCSIANIYGCGIYCFNSSPYILNNSISTCDGGGIVFDNNSNPQIWYNDISYNIGRGIKCNGGNTSVKIQNNNISYNTETGISYSYSNITISNNIISHNNTANNSSPGGIWGSVGAVIISNNIISYNTSSSSGYSGGIFCYPCNAVISKNIISNNNSVNGTGGGICFVGDTISTVSNNIIINNVSYKGGGIYCMNSSPKFINNTIANNSAYMGGGIHCMNSSSPIINNCIFYDNTASGDGDQVFLSDEPSDPEFIYNDLQGGISAFGLNGNFYTGNNNNNIDNNPLFVSSSGGSGVSYDGISANWSLQSTSPCINAGNPTGPYPATDIAGNPRIQSSAIDMGAYEFQGPTSITDNDLNDQILIYPNPLIILQ